MLKRNLAPTAAFFAALPTAAALLAALPSIAAAEGMAGPRLPGIRPLGMGNAFVAVCDDRNTLHYNPAGLRHIRGWSVSGIGLYGGVDNEFFEVVDFVRENEDVFADADLIDQEFIDSLAPYDDRWVATDANAFVDFTRNNFAIGAFTTGRFQVKVDRGVYEPRVSFNVSDDIVGLAGGATDLGRFDLSFGATAKGIWRREATDEIPASEISTFDFDNVVERIEAAEPGFAVDLGMMWWRADLPVSAGIVARNFGVVAGESIESQVDVGTAWRGFQGSGFVRGVLLAADFVDVVDFDEAFGNRFHIGGEVSLPVFSIRGGFNQGYPSVGASLNSRILSLNYAFYGRELGNFPGSEGQFIHAVEAKIGF